MVATDPYWLGAFIAREWGFIVSVVDQVRKIYLDGPKPRRFWIADIIPGDFTILQGLNLIAEITGVDWILLLSHSRVLSEKLYRLFPSIIKYLTVANPVDLAIES